MMHSQGPGPLAVRLRSGDRTALSQAITLVESTRAEDRRAARALLAACPPIAPPGLRIGITGIPGVGKSTFIDALGMALLEHGHRPAVLAVDPSSSRSAGSILGDKTRMQRLAASDQAYIRPTATGGHLGGIARRTREAILLCETAGHDRVIVETVGIGQNELAVDQVADLTVLLTLTGTGDELQAIKRGIMECADLVVVNKTDRADRGTLGMAIADLRQAIGLLPRREGRHAQVLTCSAMEGSGMTEILACIDRLDAERRANGDFDRKRRDQSVTQLRASLAEMVLSDLEEDPVLAEALRHAEENVAHGRIDVDQAAADLLSRFRKAGGPLP
ncbi:MAG: methylmalonyl Co-A mutase-associated GTPase MeaB [Flavobacteriales bacterium]|nr:methylmalonyl Co-A mutase-associated GTPase MeaB [Flavobacteriales bacterium]MCB9166190.1 methylmalonyl Co-A mutase-associated GTPase MeaB [Flavobacteriales bacterium]